MKKTKNSIPIDMFDPDDPDAPTVYSTDEVRDMFLDEVWNIIESWKTEDREPWPRRLEGVAFSILAMLDGSSIDVPGFRVEPNPHSSDKKYRQQQGKRWFPNKGDIGGCLHELFHARRPKPTETTEGEQK